MKRKRVLLVTGLVVVALIYVGNWGHLGVHWMSHQKSYSEDFGFKRADVSAKTARTYSRFGVVPSPAGWGTRAFQAALVDSVCSGLRNARCVHIATIGKHTDSRTRPIVTVYASKADALRDHAECLVMVRTKEWRCSLLPFHKGWSARVGIAIMPPHCRTGSLKHIAGVLLPDGDVMTYKATFDYHGSGTASGIFTTSDVVDDITNDIAHNLVESLDKELTDGIEKHIKGEPQFENAP